MTFQKVFIGWGPGGNSEFEKIWFKNHTDILFWQQPTVGESNSFSEYLNQSDQFLTSLVDTKKSYELIVHSFGAQVFIHWLNTQGKLPFSKIKILAANLNNLQAYETLGVEPNIRLFKASSPTLETFWAQLQEIMKDPEVSNRYWSQPGSKEHLKYVELQKTVPHLSFETYQRVINDFILKGLHEIKKPFTGIPIEIHLGTHDPLMDAKSEAEAWRDRLPEAKVFLHQAGHFIHFEKPELI